MGLWWRAWGTRASSSFGRREKRLLEEIVAHRSAIEPAVMPKIVDFAELFWANRGNHNETTSQKFLPAFTADQLQAAAARAFADGAFRTEYGDLPALASLDAVRAEVASLNAA